MIGRRATRRGARLARIVAPVSSLALLIVSCALGLNLVEPSLPDPVAFAGAEATATRTSTRAVEGVAVVTRSATPANAISAVRTLTHTGAPTATATPTPSVT